MKLSTAALIIAAAIATNIQLASAETKAIASSVRTVHYEHLNMF